MAGNPPSYRTIVYNIFPLSIELPERWEADGCPTLKPGAPCPALLTLHLVVIPVQDMIQEPQHPTKTCKRNLVKDHQICEKQRVS